MLKNLVRIALDVGVEDHKRDVEILQIIGCDDLRLGQAEKIRHSQGNTSRVVSQGDCCSFEYLCAGCDALLPDLPGQTTGYGVRDKNRDDPKLSAHAKRFFTGDRQIIIRAFRCDEIRGKDHFTQRYGDPDRHVDVDQCI